MAIIDPDGLFQGDRLVRCSDKARLLWPYFYTASNSLGRIELNYRKLYAQVFGNFRQPLTEQEFLEVIAEYHRHFLLFLYEYEGSMWGQWDTDRRFLPTYQSVKDKKSPAPPESEFALYRTTYKNSKKLPELSEKISLGIGVGVEIGEGFGIGKGPLEKTENEENMSVMKKAMSTICLKVLGVRSEPEHWTDLWNEIDELVDAYGKQAVLDKFEEWAKENRGFLREKPVSTFNKIAPGLLGGIFSSDPSEDLNPELTKLSTTLYQIGEQAFVGKNRDCLALLLKNYSTGEIVSAYAEFVSGKDDNDKKYAPKNFVEGAAVDIIESRRALRVKEDAQKTFLAKLEAEQTAAAEAEIAASEAAEQAEFESEDIL